ncbi:MAG: CNNM domain-containing protein [Thermoguttaceae bacterium]
MIGYFFFALCLGFSGLFLSAVFSGAETAFYRVPKIRLKLDAIERNKKANVLLGFVNNPGFFIATVLVGNNVANYCVSMATVLCTAALFPEFEGVAFEIGSTLVLAPFLFVFGEMFPKYLSLRAPHKMLHVFAPFLLWASRLFLPITLLFRLMNRTMNNEILRLSLGQHELTRILEEGQEIGILFETQRHLADSVFNVSNRFVREWAISLQSFPIVGSNMKPEIALEIARKADAVILPVYDADQLNVAQNDKNEALSTQNVDIRGQLPIGYVRVIDLEIAVRNQLEESVQTLLQLLQTELPICSLIELSEKYSPLTAMLLLETQNADFGCVVDEHRRPIGIVSSDQLRDVFIKE